MSIEVPIPELADELDRRPFGYLITVGDDRSAHVIALRPQVVTRPQMGTGAVILRFTTDSRRAARNVGERPDVTIVFPPVDDGGMSLIVDGSGETASDGIDVTPTWAVLHRAAPPIDQPDR